MSRITLMSSQRTQTFHSLFASAREPSHVSLLGMTLESREKFIFTTQAQLRLVKQFQTLSIRHQSSIHQQLHRDFEIAKLDEFWSRVSLDRESL